MAGGRPSTYTETITDLICERLANGESLNMICKGDDMPAQSTVFKWLSEKKEFSEKYARARESQADVLFDEILAIADSQEGDVYIKDGVEFTNHDVINRARLRVDARKWMAGKLRPKVYGDKLQHTGADGEGPVQIEDKGAYDMARRVALLLAGANDKPA